MALGRRGAAIQADSANARAIQQAVTRTVETLGGLDILVNNAGIARGGRWSRCRWKISTR